MGADRNEELLQYFKNRRVWLLEPDEKPVKLVAYERNSSPCANMVASGEARRPKAAN
jgi:hypothetical protein